MKNECVEVVDEVDDIGGVCIQMTFQRISPILLLEKTGKARFRTILHLRDKAPQRLAPDLTKTNEAAHPPYESPQRGCSPTGWKYTTNT